MANSQKKKDTPPKTKLEAQFFGGFLVECFSLEPRTYV